MFSFSKRNNYYVLLNETLSAISPKYKRICDWIEMLIFMLETKWYDMNNSCKFFLNGGKDGGKDGEWWNLFFHFPILLFRLFSFHYVSFIFSIGFIFFRQCLLWYPFGAMMYEDHWLGHSCLRCNQLWY